MAEPSPAADLPPGVLFADSFADVQGAVRRNTSGVAITEGPSNSRIVFPFLPNPVEGRAVLQVTEDHTIPGPDGQPGVLAFSWQELPEKLAYSGFAWLGKTGGGEIVLPPVAGAKTAADLQNIRLKFRYRGINPQSDMPVMLKVTCRLEANVPDSYSKRVDLGSFTATDEWQTFDMPLSEGANLDAFLQAIASESPKKFKINWGQYTQQHNYTPGDTLLVDDVEISHAPQ